MFKILLEQNKEYEERIKRLEKDNASLKDVTTTDHSTAYMSNVSIQLLSQNNVNELVSRPDVMDEATVSDMLTPIMTDTPVQTNATPIYGIDL